ncbi:hypothetical protein FA13DRAFT_1268548 [Coprinellus micaceus]|uniref:Arrestin-like N-terminal domain-containing protein n=1 Tax=Coprinellus micaceus TaxID=71717 RepID=A0A4Y7SSW3_COPMI|nr:hypothetical protein FA13DRAFT_1268548 [Coprinellus micaceus]
MYREATSILDPSLPPPTHEAPLPRTFFEKEVTTDIRYDLTLIISSGSWKFTKTESSVTTPVVYIPVTRPPPSTLGRQIANEQRTPPPGPGLDPDGWSQLSPVTIHGFYRPRRESLDVEYTIYLASPLSYSRGTVLPCCIAITCQDVEALDVLSKPTFSTRKTSPFNSIRPRCQRRVKKLHNWQ